MNNSPIVYENSIALFSQIADESGKSLHGVLARRSTRHGRREPNSPGRSSVENALVASRATVVSRVK
jgi:hypothetical protein